MKFKRFFTLEGNDAYKGIEFKITSSEIKNPDGTIVFSANDIEVPANYSQVASDVIAQKYFRKAGVPTYLKKVREKDVPSWLWRSEADEKKLASLKIKPCTKIDLGIKLKFIVLANFIKPFCRNKGLNIL